MIVLVLAASLATWDTDEISLAKPLEIIIDARAGGWACGGFAFETLTPTGVREVDGRAVWTFGADAGVCLTDTWLLFGGADWSFGGDLEILTAHLSVGYRLRIPALIPAIPAFRLDVSVGALVGDFEVDKTDFGDFQRGFGVRVGAKLAFDISNRFAAGLWFEGRYLRFEYEEDTLDGDDHAGGGGIAGGLTAELRF